jgi:hypothetical protein
VIEVLEFAKLEAVIVTVEANPRPEVSLKVILRLLCKVGATSGKLYLPVSSIRQVRYCSVSSCVRT